MLSRTAVRGERFSPQDVCAHRMYVCAHRRDDCAKASLRRMYVPTGCMYVPTSVMIVAICLIDCGLLQHFCSAQMIAPPPPPHPWACPSSVGSTSWDLSRLVQNPVPPVAFCCIRSALSGSFSERQTSGFDAMMWHGFCKFGKTAYR